MAAMADPSRLEDLQRLHKELVDLSQSQEPTEELYLELNSCVGDFSRLLDKAPRSEQSRKSLESGIYVQQTSTDGNH